MEYIYIYICGFLKLASLSTLIFGRFFLKKKKKEKKKKSRLFRIVVEFEKKKDCWKEMIKAKENVTVGIMAKFEKK